MEHTKRMPTRAGLQLNEFCEIQCDCSTRDIVAGVSLRLILASLIGYHLAGTARESRVRWTRTTRCSKNAPFLIDFQILGRIFGALDAFSMLAGAYCLALGSVHVYTYICIYIYVLSRKGATTCSASGATARFIGLHKSGLFVVRVWAIGFGDYNVCFGSRVRAATSAEVPG